MTDQTPQPIADTAPVVDTAPAPVEAQPVTTPAPAPETPQAPKSLMEQAIQGDDAPDEPATSEAPETPADDWRLKIAGGDKKELKNLERFKTEADLYNSYKELQKKLSSGEYKRDLPKDATPKQVAEWRKERGIPEAPDGYELKLPDGVVLGDNDKPYVDSFLSHVHGKAWTPEQVNDGIEWYIELQDAENAKTYEAEEKFKTDAVATLRKEWAEGFQANLNRSYTYFQSLPQEVQDAFYEARNPDKSKLIDTPALFKFFASLSEQQSPQGVLLPSGAAGDGPNVAARLGEIRKMIGDPMSDYHVGPRKKAIRSEFMQLLEVEERGGQR